MTVGTISIIIGVILLLLLKWFFNDENVAGENRGPIGGEEIGSTDIDASDDPGLAHLPGNSYHSSWSAKQLDAD
ncbi:hypothetical protein [Desulfogranum marinum]|uniref:hypothetical protein n=1 Tax=Desulfogranum marinum TaxID=453220 RepID=UPI0029C7ADCF|nr:hypothetical protein [Desulfogranum marinum]